MRMCEHMIKIITPYLLAFRISNCLPTSDVKFFKHLEQNRIQFLFKNPYRKDFLT